MHGASLLAVHEASARKLAVANHKGGCGKTTTVVNLAATLAERGRRVLIVDLDPQACATSWCGVTSTPGLDQLLHGLPSLEEVVHFSMNMGPMPGVLADVDDATRQRVADAIAEALRPHQGPAGVSLPCAAWIATARR